MKDWKERVTSNRKLVTINASAGSCPAMPFGHRPAGERAPAALASQKMSRKLQHDSTVTSPVHRHPSSQLVVGREPSPGPPKSRQGVLNHQGNVAKLR